ncbi:MAG TPA: DUF3052 domain-containing protein [Gemmatimonadales bacterium]|nr:DUF3052 domain-containing protein [Gemmatimonadales bacterium]
MSGYSGTPLAKKLGLDDQARLVILGAPWEYAKTVGIPSGQHQIATRLGKSEEFIHLFAAAAADLGAFDRIAKALVDTGIVWVSWPKRSSGVPTDLTEEIVRQAGLKAGLVDVKVCAIDEVWSGLKFVRRIKDRAGKGHKP